MSYDDDIMLTIDGTLIRETDMAYLIDTGSKEVWIPKSASCDNNDGTFDVEKWLAYEKGLI